MAVPFLRKIAPFHRRPGPPSNTWFLQPTRVHKPKDISIGSAVFAGLTIVTDRQTDHVPPSVTIGHIYLRTTAMLPKNEKFLHPVIPYIKRLFVN